MDFPVEKPTTVRTNTNTTTDRILALVFSFFAGFVAFKVSSFIEPLGPYLPLVFASFAAFCAHKLTSGSIRKDAYDCLTFMGDSLVVHYTYKPDMKVDYKDIVEATRGGHESSAYLTLTGNYPILFLHLSRLEFNAERKFVDYMRKSGRL